ncbi:MAG: acetyl-CoA carboxylase carboxyltransferase subunit alpha [Spirochaetaceae bacterium]
MSASELERKIEELRRLAASERPELESEISRLTARLKSEGQEELPEAWHRVQTARHPKRPTTLDYISSITDRFCELHGDRAYGDDQALIGGVASIEGRYVTILGHQKGRTMKENLSRNYGMGHPEGYRKALRLAKQAEKFRRPIVSFIDTPGAYPGLASEERGVAQAIAENLRDFSVLRTPIVCIVIGEGGSGGALGIGVGDRVYMMENSIYSVISPEGFASILLRDASKAKEAATLMRLTAPDLLSFKLIDGIIPEPPGGAHTDPAYTAGRVRIQLAETLRELGSKPIDVLLRERSQRILAFSAHRAPPKKRGLFGRPIS